MKRIIVFLILIPLILRAEWDSDDEDLSLFHHVNVISGNLNLSFQDGVIKGAKNFPINRSYTSAGAFERSECKYKLDLRKIRGDSVMQGGWSWFPHLNLYVEPPSSDEKYNRETKYKVYIPEKNGNLLCYVFSHQENNQHIFKPEFKGGQCTGTLSARRNSTHNVLKFNIRQQKATLYLPDGGVRVYKDLSWHESDRPYYLALVSETTPSKHDICYVYKKHSNEIKNILVRNPLGTKIFTTASFNFVKPDELMKPSDHFHFQITTSDNSVFDYRSVGIKQRNYLSSIKSNRRPEESSEFSLARKGIGARMQKLHLGGVLQFIAHYYGPENHKAAMKWEFKAKKPFNADKVRLLEAPIGPNSEILPLARFSYLPNHTDVRDVDNILTRYHHDGEQLQRIEHYDEKDSLHSSQQLLWNGSHLISKALLDQNGNAVFSRTFAYDTFGNVLEEAFWGNLTGEQQGPFLIDDHGNLSGAQVYRRRFEYLPVFNVPTLETEEGGLTYRYAYLEGTDLLARKLTCDEKKILIREFYFYDSDHLLVCEVIDDGEQEDHSHISGVTQRSIKRYERHPQNGMILAAEERYLDMASGNEVLIKRSEYTYSLQNEMIAEAVYDANRTYRYTLYTDYDPCGRIIRKTTPLSQENTYVYDANGNLLEANEAGCPKKIYTYNLSGKPTSCQEIDAAGDISITYSQYDPKGRLLSQTDKRGNTTTQSYDAFGRCINTRFSPIEQDSGKPCFPVANYTYDLNGNIASTTNSEGSQVKTSYNSLRKPIHIIQADGTEVFHTYTKSGMLARTVHPDQTQTEYTYDLFQRMTSKTTYAANGEILAQESWSYSAFHLISYTDCRGLTTEYSYDGAGRIVIEDAEGRKKTYAYDSLGFLERITDGPVQHVQIHDIQGRVIEEWIEDESGRRENRMQFFYGYNNRKEKAIRWTSQGEAIDHFSYDSEGRLIQHIDPIGAITEWQYREVENQISQRVLQKQTIDPIKNRTIETYDSLNHISCIEKQDPQGKTVAYDRFYYDSSGNRTKRISTIYQSDTPVKTVATTWEYDPMGRVVSENEADQKTTRYQYDLRGRVAEKTLPSGTILTYIYDGIDRLLELLSSDGTVHYTYFHGTGPDPTLIIDHIHQFRIQRSYNHFGDLLHEISGIGFQYAWKYDQHGRCSLFTLPNQASIVYSYKGLHLSTVTKYSPEGYQEYAHHYTRFDPNGHVQEEELINSLSSVSSQRDLLERPISQTSSYALHSIAYSLSGLVMQTGNSLFGTKDYAYDPLNQITKEAETDYAFDSFGNPTDCEINDCNQLLANNDSSFQYDPDGNPTKRTSKDGTAEYHYDALGRLTMLIKPERTVRYCYDPLSRLISKETEDLYAGRSKIFYLYDREHEIGTAKENGEILQLKVLGLGIMGDIGAAVAIELDGEVFAPLHDFNGNIIALISSQGKVAEAYDIDAFGKEKDSAQSSPWRFCSKRTEEGLVFFGKRFYDPSLGRWLTPDPAGSIDSPNLYLYVRNSPLNRLDLFGLYSARPVPWSNRTEDSPRIEISVSDVNALERGDLVWCKGVVGGVEIDAFVMSRLAHQLKFTADECKTGIVNIFDHFSELLPNAGIFPPFATCQNGINTKRQEFGDMGYNLATFLPKETLLIGIYNRTEGLVKDSLRAMKELFGKETPIVDRTRQMMTACLDVLSNTSPEGLWLHVMHSEAGVIGKNAIEGMTSEQRKKLRNHMIGLGIAPAAPLSKCHTLDAISYYSEKDQVTLQYGELYLNDPNYDIQVVKCRTPSSDLDFFAGDHGYFKPTNQGSIKNGFDRFRDKFDSYNVR